MSERLPGMSCPRASWSSSCRSSPARLSEPVISQFVPADVNEVGTGTSALVSLELTLKYTATPATTISATSPARMARMRRGRRRDPRRRYPPPPPPPPPVQDCDGGWAGHAVLSPGPAPAAFRWPCEPAGVKLGCGRCPPARGWSGSSLYHPRGQSLLMTPRP